MPSKTIVNVTMTRENGWYIATSTDLSELIVCHQNFVRFTQEIPECIKALYKANHNMDVDVEELTSMESKDISSLSFEAKIKKAEGFVRP